MSGTVRTYLVSPEFWNDQPEAAAKLIAEQTAQHPDDTWLIVIGERETTRPWLDNILFNYAPAKEIEPAKT